MDKEKRKIKRQKRVRITRYVRISALEVICLNQWCKRNKVSIGTALNRYKRLFPEKTVITSFQAKRLLVRLQIRKSEAQKKATARKLAEKKRVKSRFRKGTAKGGW